MTPWLRPLLMVTVLMAVSPVSLSYAGVSYAGVPYAAEPSPSATRAGSAPGEGRARPGRDEPAPPVEASVPPREPLRQLPTPPPVPPPAVPPLGETTTASDATRRTAAEPALPGLRVLPLGSGLVLIGLGLGFFAVRLRRG
ncbi:hypothetical protein [Streptomyces sp. Je 1-332]|uniref:hypothetical protein n=1 Tax=Streptomyces sp. Je 1-332 TaxID=3231270 RepID=UPI003458F13B